MNKKTWFKWSVFIVYSPVFLVGFFFSREKEFKLVLARTGCSWSGKFHMYRSESRNKSRDRAWTRAMIWVKKRKIEKKNYVTGTMKNKKKCKLGEYEATFIFRLTSVCVGVRCLFYTQFMVVNGFSHTRGSKDQQKSKCMLLYVSSKGAHPAQTAKRFVASTEHAL